MGHPLLEARRDHVIRGCCFQLILTLGMCVCVCVCLFVSKGLIFIGSLSGRFVFLTTFVATLALFNIIFGLDSILLVMVAVGVGLLLLMPPLLQRKFE